MEQVEVVIEGRKYKAYQDGSGNNIIIGPPEGLVDIYPEPFATTLHNILYARGILTRRDAVKRHKELFGALQEALTLDAQKLQEAFFRYSQESQEDHNDS